MQVLTGAPRSPSVMAGFSDNSKAVSKLEPETRKILGYFRQTAKDFLPGMLSPNYVHILKVLSILQGLIQILSIP